MYLFLRTIDLPYSMGTTLIDLPPRWMSSVTFFLPGKHQHSILPEHSTLNTQHTRTRTRTRRNRKEGSKQINTHNMQLPTNPLCHILETLITHPKHRLLPRSVTSSQPSCEDIGRSTMRTERRTSYTRDTRCSSSCVGPTGCCDLVLDLRFCKWVWGEVPGGIGGVKLWIFG